MTDVSLSEWTVFRNLMSLDLPVADYAIFGSGPLVAHGIKAVLRDLDVVIRGAAWRQVLSLGRPEAAPSGCGLMVRLFDGTIEFFDSWVSEDWDVEKIIDSAELIGGLPFVALNTVLESKRRSNRLKDQDDIAAIERHLRRNL